MKKSDSALKIQNATKIFNLGEWNEIKAVVDFSWSFNWGESVLLIGDNGSGKSTLLNLISGELSLSKGDILVGNQSIVDWPIHHRSTFIYRIHQDPMAGVAPFGTVAENLAMAKINSNSLFSLQRLINLKDTEQFIEALKKLKPELVDKLNHKVFLLSPGQQQALALALLAMQSNDKHRILLADEPTAALDPDSTNKCLDLIKEKAEKGWLCLMITHSRDIINNHRGRIIKMSNGKLIGEETR